MATRFCDKWRIDSDYKHKLADGDRRWLAQFEDEYYRGRFGRDLLDHHAATHRIKTFRARNAAFADLVTKSGTAVAHHIGTPLQRKADWHRYYEPSDYVRGEYGGGNPEDAIIAIIDAKYAQA